MTLHALVSALADRYQTARLLAVVRAYDVDALRRLVDTSGKSDDPFNQTAAREWGEYAQVRTVDVSDNVLQTGHRIIDYVRGEVSLADVLRGVRTRVGASPANALHVAAAVSMLHRVDNPEPPRGERRYRVGRRIREVIEDELNLDADDVRDLSGVMDTLIVKASSWDSGIRGPFPEYVAEATSIQPWQRQMSTATDWIELREGIR